MIQKHNNNSTKHKNRTQNNHSNVHAILYIANMIIIITTHTINRKHNDHSTVDKIYRKHNIPLYIQYTENKILHAAIKSANSTFSLLR